MDESVLASNSAGRVLDLPDGSQVEMRAQSQLRIDHAGDGLRIRLIAGSVIVTAAKQGSGHLYVATSDAMVSVVGTVFVVTIEQSGSRVGVIEGVVNVGGGAISQKLFPGQQVATNPAMGQVPIDVQVAWSRKAAMYLGMLATLQPSVAPAQSRSAAAAAAGPQSQPAAAPQNREEPRSLLILGNKRPPFATTPEAERAMEQALASRELYTDVSIMAEVDVFQANRAEYFVPITLKIPGTQLAGSPNAKRIALDIIGEVTDS
jgi:hypothetical protein